MRFFDLFLGNSMTKETIFTNLNEIKPTAFSNINAKTCPGCQNTFDSSTCNSGSCWCDKYPSIIELVPGRDCLCEVCLKAEVIKTIDEFMNGLTPDKIKKAQKLGPARRPQKGIDYTFTQEGYKKFTGWYLLRQGGCCGNDCSNCPY
jgi:hypothetical protein